MLAYQQELCSVELVMKERLNEHEYCCNDTIAMKWFSCTVLNCWLQLTVTVLLKLVTQL